MTKPDKSYLPADVYRIAVNTTTHHTTVESVLQSPLDTIRGSARWRIYRYLEKNGLLALMKYPLKEGSK
jgi:hypothetical protein